jgi:hypothetical protein
MLTSKVCSVSHASGAGSFYELLKPMHDGGFPTVFPISPNLLPIGIQANLSKVSFYTTRLMKEKWRVISNQL